MAGADHNCKTAFAFPGVGVRPSGCEAKFYRRHESLISPFLQEASEASGTDLEFALQQNQIERLSEGTRQYFTFSFCAGVTRVLEEHGLVPEMAAGYSFGIYAALEATKVISYSDGLRILEKAYDLMKAACNGSKAGMGFVVGLKRNDIERLLAKNCYDSIRLVNTNSDTCNIFAGRRGNLESFLAEAQSYGALAAERLSVAIPYHHPTLLEGVAPEFKRFLRKFKWQDPICPIVSSIDQKLLDKCGTLVDFTSQNLSTPNNWQAVVGALASHGIRRVVECGPGISLTQNGRFLEHDIKFVNVKNMKKGLGI